jgi:hypothetical protein
MKIESQVTVKDGERLTKNVKDSSVIDFVVPSSKGPIAIESKCPVVPKTRNLNQMADRTAGQLIKADKNLPKGTKQEVWIDNRTQGLSKQVQKDMRQRIVEKSGGVVKKPDIHFEKPE